MRINIGFSSLFSSRNSLLRHPLARFGKISLGIGAFLFLLGIIVFAIVRFATDNGQEAFTALLVLSLQGIVWFTLGCVFTGINGNSEKKLRTLKQIGRRFEAEIIDLNPVIGINAGIYLPTVYAECIYVNDEGRRCKVKSAMFLWESFLHDKLEAAVYVDYNDPRRYAVEITRRGNGNGLPPVDIDYT
jgi:hypothetical protein